MALSSELCCFVGKLCTDFNTPPQQDGEWMSRTPILSKREDNNGDGRALVSSSANWELNGAYAVEIIPSFILS